METVSQALKRLEADFESNGLPSIMVKPGPLPVLVSAPHAVNHWRNGALKPADLYTGAMALWLQEQTGCSVICAGSFSKQDGNFDAPDVSEYKQILARFVNEHPLHLVLDLHGASNAHPFDAELGTGPDWSGRQELAEEVKRCLTKAGIPASRIAVDEKFRAAKSQTVTRFVIEALKLPAIQVEVTRRLRDPEKPGNAEKILTGLKEVILRHG